MALAVGALPPFPAGWGGGAHAPGAPPPVPTPMPDISCLIKGMDVAGYKFESF